MRRRTPSADDGWLLTYADLITNLLIFFAMLMAASEPSRTKMQQIAEGLSGIERPESLAQIRKQIEAQIEAESLEEHIFTELTDEGLKLSLNSGLVFASGSAEVRAEQQATLDRMLAQLVPYASRYAFAVEGHTDSTPLVNGTLYKTNWELSTARANAVRERLEQVGVAHGRIRVEGYADTVPLPPDQLEGLSEAEQLALHRRVIVRIY